MSNTDTTEQKRLFLLDAYALIFRGYYAFIKNPRINSKAQNTSAVFGFMLALFDVIRREKPDHLAVAFDKEGSAERTELFADYKANRDETPEPIRWSIPHIKSILKAMHIPCLEIAGVEADDLIGTLAKQAEKEDFKVYMVTPDKDYAQLVSENIFMYRPSRMGNDIEIWGIPEVQKRFEVESPLQVIDYLGMMGDSSDNIPGLPGVGDKTAKKFIKQYGNMEGLLEHADEIKGKMGERLRENKEIGILSKKLATIRLDCDVQFDAKDFTLDEPDVPAVQALFEELEFRRLQTQFLAMVNGEGKKLKPGATPSENQAQAQLGLFGQPGTEGTASLTSDKKTLADTDHHYQLVEGALSRKLFLEKLLQQKEVSFDTETTSLDTAEAELVGIAFSWEAGKGYYLPCSPYEDEVKELLEPLRTFFESETIVKIAQNMKYDLKVLHKYGINIRGPLFDTMLAHYLINPDMRHNMDLLAETYLNYTPQPITELIGKGRSQISMREVSLNDQKEYAVEDADITLQLAQKFKAMMKENETEKLFYDIEMPLMPVLAAMEQEGINLDEDFLKELEKAAHDDLIRLQGEIFALAEMEFKISSPKQLGEVLFDHMKLVDRPKKTKTGQYTTSEDVLSELADKHPIINKVLEWRQLKKLLSTYITALPTQVAADGRVHTDYMQAVAATGRLSSNNPNLQNIPIRTERGREVRKAFIPRDENHVLMAADYSQIELRIIAALSQEDTMIEAFANNEDIHTSTASRVFGVPIDEVTREQRSNAKTVNFGIIYGVSAFGLSNQTNLSRAESKELIDLYYQTYPKLRAYMQDQIEEARQKGYVETVLGRRRYLPMINSRNQTVRGQSERNAVNAPIQGSAADIIKIAMINIHKELQEGNYQTKMLLQVHDELVFDVPRDELEKVKAMITEKMESAYTLAVPLDVEAGVGENWLEAH